MPSSTGRSTLVTLFLLAAMLAMTVPVALAQSSAPAQPSASPSASPPSGPSGLPSLADADRRFLEQVASQAPPVVAASRVAAARARDDEVRQLAGRLIRDHEAIRSELVALAGRKGARIEVAEEPAAEDGLARVGVDPGAGPAFDRDFTAKVGAEVVGDTIELFRRASAEAADVEVRAFAVRNAILLEHQREKARLLAMRLAGQ